MPPYWRKSGSKRGKRYHLVPIVSWGAKAVCELDKIRDFEGSSGWLFPARGPNSTKSADDGLLNDYLEVMPGIGFSPQCVRYALAEYGERTRILGWHVVAMRKADVARPSIFDSECAVGTAYWPQSGPVVETKPNFLEQS